MMILLVLPSPRACLARPPSSALCKAALSLIFESNKGLQAQLMRASQSYSLMLSVSNSMLMMNPDTALAGLLEELEEDDDA